MRPRSCCRRRQTRPSRRTSKTGPEAEGAADQPQRLLPIASPRAVFPAQHELPSIHQRGQRPSGKVPCLMDDGFAVWDSLAILEYLAERHAGVWPEDARARAWARCASAEMHSGFFALRNQCGMNCGVRIRLHETTAALKADLDRLDALWREGLLRHGGPFLAGERFTAVDACFAPVAFRVQSYGLALSVDSMAYVQRLLALAPMQDWYDAALGEPWRDEAHEAEQRQYGAVMLDLRRA